MDSRLPSTTRKAKPSKAHIEGKVIVKMIRTCLGCDEKVYAEEFEKGKTYNIGESLAKVFTEELKVARKVRLVQSKKRETPEKSIEVETPEK